jgi:hypothetical protein
VTRILYISSILPDTSCGAHIAIYRHFVLKQDFDVAVCGYVSDNALVTEKFTLARPRLFARIFKTRFSRIAYNVEYFFNWHYVPASLEAYARRFDPDAIFTVPDNMHSGLAFGLSRKLGKPLIVDFQDLFPISKFIPAFMEPYPWMRRYLMRKTIYLERHADLAFYTSEGMLRFFQGNKNGHVLYPIGDFELASTPARSGPPSARLKLVYAGNCYGAYGRMLLSFAKLVRNSPDIDFKIFPVGKGWSDSDIAEMTAAGIYQSFLPFAELKKQLESCDAFLTVMSFEEGERPFVSTSFTTKWLDYAPLGKPIFVWAPDYSSATIFAKKYHCGIVTSTPEPGDLLRSLRETAADATRWNELGKTARNVSQDVLNPEKIHELLVREVNKLLSSNA